MSRPRWRVALLGDRSTHASHRELDALIPVLAGGFDVEAVWVPTDSAFDVASYSGVWLVPGSPYADDDAVLSALRRLREARIPFLGTCGGMQYAVVEFTRNVAGKPASHEESDGRRDDNVVSALACSLRGEERLVTPSQGSRFSTWCPEPFVGMHFCGYGATAAAIEGLVRHGVTVGATAPDAGAEVLEFPDHPFYVTSMFQPHIGTLAGRPVHPLIRAFVAAIRDERADTAGTGLAS